MIAVVVNVIRIKPRRRLDFDMDMTILRHVFYYAACKGMAERSPEFETEEVWDGARWVLVRKTALAAAPARGIRRFCSLCCQ